MGEDTLFTELYIQDGVLVEEIVPNKEDFDFQNNVGTLKVVEYSSNLEKFIEWHEFDVSIESHDQEWAIVQDVKNNAQDDIRMSKSPIIRIKMKSLISIEISQKNRRFRIAGSSEKVTFCFQNGNADSFLNFLKEKLRSSIRQRTPSSYVIVNHKEVQALEKSFAELNLFTDERTRSDVLWNYFKRWHENPYETTMDTFCKVTNTLLYRSHYESEDERAELLRRSFTADEVNDANVKTSSGEYQLVTKGLPLPPRSSCPRGKPLDLEQWIGFFDDSGRILQPERVKEIIFHGGIESEDGLRREVWKFLLCYYPWNSTARERCTLRQEKEKDYFRMKNQWKSMSPDQADRFSAYKMHMSLIEKDVHRTDRTMEFFAGDDNPNLICLQDILMTYVMYNFDLGYVQGMSDLLSPLLVQIKDEVDTFWCFVGFMNRVSRNFELDQEGMKEQLQQLYCLLCAVEPELANSLDQDTKNMSFCFRWLLVWFKREFTYEDIFLLWEVLWTEFLCKNYHLIVCVAILDNEKERLMSSNFGFTEILKHINELAEKMNLEEILCKSEGIYVQMSNASNIPVVVKEILDLDGGLTANNWNNQGPCNIKVSEYERKSCDIKDFVDNDQESMFDQSLNMQFL